MKNKGATEMDISKKIKKELNKIENEYKYKYGSGTSIKCLYLYIKGINKIIFKTKDINYEIDSDEYEKNKDKVLEELYLYNTKNREPIILKREKDLVIGVDKLKTIKEVSEEYGIPIITLKKRLEYKSYNLIKGKDYYEFGNKNPKLLAPNGVEKIIVRSK